MSSRNCIVIADQSDDPGRENVYNKLSRGDFLSVISEEDVTALAKKYIQPLESPSRLSDEASTKLVNLYFQHQLLFQLLNKPHPLLRHKYASKKR